MVDTAGRSNSLGNFLITHYSHRDINVSLEGIASIEPVSLILSQIGETEVQRGWIEHSGF